MCGAYGSGAGPRAAASNVRPQTPALIGARALKGAETEWTSARVAPESGVQARWACGSARGPKPEALKPPRARPLHPNSACHNAAGAYNWEDVVAVAAWLTQPLAGRCGPRQWGLSVSSFPDSSGYGWNLALGRSDGGHGHGAGQGPVAERRGGPGSRRTSWGSACSDDGLLAAPESGAIQQRRQPAGSSGVPELHGDATTAGSAQGLGLLAESAGAGSDRSSRDQDVDQGLGAAPYIAEASLQFPIGEGVHVIPGLVAVRRDGRLTLSILARTQWFF